MSQCATLYRITKEDFEKIVAQQDSLDLLDTKADYATFAGTHEGLKFLLSKFGNPELVEQIFYPNSFIGHEVDYKNMDDEALESLSSRIYYLAPKVIIEIAALLDQIQVDHFRKHFDPEELNKENIYPWQWTNNKENDTAYNEEHITQDFENLKSLFETSILNKNYILSYVG